MQSTFVPLQSPPMQICYGSMHSGVALPVPQATPISVSLPIVTCAVLLRYPLVQSSCGFHLCSPPAVSTCAVLHQCTFYALSTTRYRDLSTTGCTTRFLKPRPTAFISFFLLRDL